MYLDKELSSEQSDQISSHLDNCANCSRQLQELKLNLDFLTRGLASLEECSRQDIPPPSEQMWKGIKQQVLLRKKGRYIMRMKKMAVACSLVLALGLVLAVPSWRAAAGNLLQVFRVEKVESLTLSAEDMDQINRALNKGDPNIDLKNYGSIECSGDHQRVEIARQQLGSISFPVRLPQGFSDAGKAYLEGSAQIRVTPQVEKLNALLVSLGSQQMLPAELKGKTFTIKTNQMVSLEDAGYVLIQGPAPSVEAPEGVDVDQLVQAIMAVPIWPSDVKQQMLAIRDWKHTLVVPGEQVEKVNINGVQGVWSRQGSQQCLVWQDQGILFMLFDKSGNTADLVNVARSLR